MAETGADPDAYAQIGAAACAAGTPAFASRVLDLMGGFVPHDYLWAVRYADVDATHVFETRAIDQRLVEDYKDRYHQDDPFGRYWRRLHATGMVAFAQAIDNTASSRRYQAEFLSRAAIRDELGLLVPLPGDACLGLFLESKAHFSDRDRAFMDVLRPTIEALCYTHVARLLTTELADVRPLTAPMHPILILDRTGSLVHSNLSWSEVETRLPPVDDLMRLAMRGDRGSIDLTRSTLAYRHLPDDYLPAPGGTAFLVVWDDGHGVEPPIPVIPPAQPLTRLEIDIRRLVMQSQSSGEIAGELDISKATVKKYKIRLYRKYGVNSERQLVSLFR